MNSRKTLICPIAFLGCAAAVSIAGCSAGSANIPSDLPAPTKIGGPGPKAQKLEDIAKAKGLLPPVAPVKAKSNFNPTNP